MLRAFGDQVGVYPVSVEVFLDGYSGPRRHTYQFLWKSGWLRVSEVEVRTPLANWRKQLVACVTDHGQVIPSGVAARLFEMPVSAPKEVEHAPPDDVDEATDALYWDFLGCCDRMALAELDAANTKVEAYVSALEHRFERVARTAEDKIRAIRKRLRAPNSVLDREASQASIERLSVMVDRIPAALRKRVLEAREPLNELERKVNDSLGAEGSLREVFTLYWTTKPRWRGRRLRRMPIQEETYTAYSRPAEAEQAAAEPAGQRKSQPRKHQEVTDFGASSTATGQDEGPIDEALFQKILERDAARELAVARRTALELTANDD